jgi:hypothetical protein
MPDGVNFLINAVADGVAYGEAKRSGDLTVARLDLTTGRVTTIAPIASDAGGVGALVVEPPWVVWEQLDSQTQLENWSIHAWNQSTGATWVVATNARQPDGTYLPGQQPLPVLQGAQVAWAQPIQNNSAYVTAELRVVNLNSRKSSTLDSGRLSSPVHAGQYLVWAKIDADGAYSLKAIDAASRKPVTLPDRVRDPGQLMFVGGSSQYLAWTIRNNQELMVWQVSAARYTDLAISDTRHYFQFLQLAGHFVVWYTGIGSSVLDLTTGGAFDISGTAAASPNMIVLEQHDSLSKFTFTASRISAVRTSDAPVIPGCTA